MCGIMQSFIYYYVDSFYLRVCNATKYVTLFTSLLINSFPHMQNGRLDSYVTTQVTLTVGNLTAVAELKNKLVHYMGKH